MIKIDLNIKIDDLDLKGEETSFEVSKRFIITALSWIQTGESGGLKVMEQRKIYKILDSLENQKEGIIELEDDIHNYLKEVFNRVEWSGGTKVIVRVADRIDKILENGSK